MENSLQVQQEMQMKLAPQVIQSIEILQLPLLELEQKIDQELEENPLLELESAHDNIADESENSPDNVEDEHDKTESEEPGAEEELEAERFEMLDDLTNYYEQNATGQPKSSNDEKGGKLEAMENTQEADPTLQEHLLAQLVYLAPEEPLQTICKSIITDLDEKGYLEHSLEEILSAMDIKATQKDKEKALRIVQSMEPPGVGARDLKECLLLQLDRRDEEYELTAEIIKNHFEDLTRNRLPRIAHKTGSSLNKIKEVVDKIGALNPRPGALFSTALSPHVLPDINIYAENGGYEVMLENAWLPSLRISAYYARRLQDKNLDEKTREYLSNKLNAAQGIISAIEQRRATLENVAEVIVKEQKEFLDKGEMYLKPLKMQDVADEVGIHVSTVSRAISGKYAQTPQGIYSLKKFFTGGTLKKDGSMASWEVVRQKLMQIVRNEDKNEPLSDDTIAAELQAQGIDIARRTVAKYRKQLNIPSSRIRREY